MDVLFDFPVFQKPTVVCLGNFDGVHRGHQLLIQETVKCAKELKLPSVVLTFEPHPENVLYPDKQFKRILTNELKAELIAKLGVDYLIFLPFTKEVAKMPPEEFITVVLEQNCKASHIFTGFNYTFGNGGTGNPDTLLKFAKILGYQFHVIPPYIYHEKIVSSSLIRSYLSEGKIEEAKELLGYWPILRGKVVHGEQLGTTLGFPTANIEIVDEILTPLNGVYASQIYYGTKRFWGMTNIGLKPTVGKNLSKTIEVNIFDFNDNIYGATVTLELMKFIRPEQKFNSLSELKNQLVRDEKEIRNYLNKTCVEKATLV